jgi:hypothetical protein
MERECKGCDKKFRPAELAPYAKDAEGKLLEACRKCINSWMPEFLWPSFPFWMRQKGLDTE